MLPGRIWPTIEEYRNSRVSPVCNDTDTEIKAGFNYQLASIIRVTEPGYRQVGRSQSTLVLHFPQEDSSLAEHMIVQWSLVEDLQAYDLLAR
jgi:hypothetical protein